MYQAGVGHKDMKTKFAPFNSLLGHEVGHDGSARLIHEDESVKDFTETHFHDDVDVEEVEVVRFAKFITEVVAKRKLPVSAQVITPRVVIKADIEGAELKVMIRKSLYQNSNFSPPIVSDYSRHVGDRSFWSRGQPAHGVAWRGFLQARQGTKDDL